LRATISQSLFVFDEMNTRFPGHSSSPAELQEQLRAERRAVPFVAYRTEDRQQRLLEFGEGLWRVTIGRAEGCDIRLDADEEVSRLHAVLERIGQEWVLIDDGLSRNGTFYNGERLAGRRTLHDGDAIRIGSTLIVYRAPGRPRASTTHRADKALSAASITPTQRRILVALCRPFRDGHPFATVPTNQAIAVEVALSVDRVKAHLHTLFETFDVGALPQNQKRVRLVERAMQSGVISRHDL
jgi:predicted component of type VI protein secretion system